MRMLDSFLKKDKSLIILHLMALRCCLLHLIKQNCLLKTLLRTFIFLTQASLYLLSLLWLILKIHRISAALRLVKVALYFSINIPYGLPWGFAVMSGLVLLITTCICRISYRNKVYGTVGPSHGACFDTWNCFVDYFCYLFSSVK